MVVEPGYRMALYYFIIFLACHFTIVKTKKKKIIIMPVFGVPSLTMNKLAGKKGINHKLKVSHKKFKINGNAENRKE